MGSIRVNQNPDQAPPAVIARLANPTPAGAYGSIAGSSALAPSGPWARPRSSAWRYGSANASQPMDPPPTGKGNWTKTVQSWHYEGPWQPSDDEAEPGDLWGSYKPSLARSWDRSRSPDPQAEPWSHTPPPEDLDDLGDIPIEFNHTPAFLPGPSSRQVYIHRSH